MGTKGQKLLTVQKRQIAEVIAGMEGLFTARDLCLRLAVQPARVSRATAYRVLAMLCAEGEVLEFWLPGGKRVCARSGGNFHRITECEICGRLEYGSSRRKIGETVLHTMVYRRVKCCVRKFERSAGYAFTA